MRGFSDTEKQGRRLYEEGSGDWNSVATNQDPTSHQKLERSKKAFSPKALGGSIAPLKPSFLTSGLQENEFLLL